MRTRTLRAGLVCLASFTSIATLPVTAAAAAAAAGVQTIAQEIDRDKAEIRQYRLTMPKIRAMAQATLAFAKEVESDPALAKKIKDSNEPDAATLSEFAARIDKEPRLAAAVKTAGLTPREYATLTLCYFPAMYAYGLKKQGKIKDIPADILADNIALIAANEAELNRINQELEAHDTNK
jgi:hypothetical protein